MVLNACLCRSLPAGDADYWSENLPVNYAGLEAPHIATPYTCKTNLYVSKTGSDANDGSQGSPWLTIAHALSVLSAQGGEHGGVCINVDDGIYNEAVNAGSLSGSSDTPTGYFVLRSVHPHRAVIQVPLGLKDFLQQLSGYSEYCHGSRRNQHRKLLQCSRRE